MSRFLPQVPPHACPDIRHLCCQQRRAAALGASRAAAGQSCRPPSPEQSAARGRQGGGEPPSPGPSSRASTPALACRDEGSPLRYPGAGSPSRSESGGGGGQGPELALPPVVPRVCLHYLPLSLPSSQPQRGGYANAAGARATCPGRWSLSRAVLVPCSSGTGLLCGKASGKFSGKINSLRLNKDGTGGHPLPLWWGAPKIRSPEWENRTGAEA